MIENFKDLEVRFKETPLLEHCKLKDITKLDVTRLDMPLLKKGDINSRNELNFIDRSWIRLDSGWSNEIVRNLASFEEYNHYKEIGLEEVMVGDKPCLVKQDIDFNQKEPIRKTNEERMSLGKAPLDRDGRPIELHHIGQHDYSPLAQLTMEEHRGEGVDTILHEKNKVSEIDRSAFDKERANHWKQFQQLNI